MEFGRWQTPWTRHWRFSAERTWDRIHGRFRRTLRARIARGLFLQGARTSPFRLAYQGRLSAVVKVSVPPYVMPMLGRRPLGPSGPSRAPRSGLVQRKSDLADYSCGGNEAAFA